MKRFFPKPSRLTICYGIMLCLCLGGIFLSVVNMPDRSGSFSDTMVSFAKDWQTDGRSVGSDFSRLRGDRFDKDASRYSP
ncbi:MAG: hypothetical protein IJ682_11715 [Lachnospiraceae bacterium]|nr:hypothetical protein [Lachnospiraceae bacterium]